MFGWKRNDDSSKDSLRSSGHEACTTRIIELDAKVKQLKNTVDILETNVENLRGKFNRQLKGLTPEEEKPKEKEQQTINSNEYIAFG